jgi:ribosomal protein S18 acetylase RimI-like enzyme
MRIKVNITKMKIEDYDEVFLLWQNSEGMGLHKQMDSKKGIAKYLRRNPGLSLVARDNKKIVGTVLCGHDGRRGHLYHLAVAPSYRKKGIGKMLVNQALSKLAAIGLSRCTIHTFAKNYAGRKFWKHIGWTERPDVKIITKDIEC